MKTFLSIVAYSYYFTCVSLLLSNDAHAYIDPSTTTYIIQTVAGILIALGASFTIFRHKIVAAWRKWYYGRLAKKNEQDRRAKKKEDK